MLEDFRDRLDNISPSMCAAKWQQVTIHLGTGQTHSCHHPNTHHIPIKEIAIDVSALHNTKFKKEQRKLMIEGIRPSECEYCWRVEDSDKQGKVFSDRITKSMEPWAEPYIRDIVKAPYDNVYPTYVEVSFSNACNFKCSYCSPEISSKWMEEIKQHGPYPTTNRYNSIDWLQQQNKMPFTEREHNPYTEAFWGWWPELYPKLHVFRITGGEPLMTKHTFRVLEHILDNPNPRLELNINSNLCVPDELFDRFIALMQRIMDARAVKNFKLYTSCEATGAKAEYIRFGLDYNRWLDNCHRIMNEIPGSRLTVMSTYNALSVTSFKDFLRLILQMKSRYDKTGVSNPISLDIPYLRYPSHQSVDILTDDYVSLIKDQLDFMQMSGFYPHEINRMHRTYQALTDNTRPRQDIDIDRKNFVLFVDEHDRRRGTDFISTFPEMEKFYNFCKSKD